MPCRTSALHECDEGEYEGDDETVQCNERNEGEDEGDDKRVQHVRRPCYKRQKSTVAAALERDFMI